MSLTELNHYIRCPYYYKFRWVDNSPLFKIKAKEHWRDCLKVTAIDYFKTWVQEDKQPSSDFCQNLWQKNWYDDIDRTALDFSDCRSGNFSSLGNAGWLDLLKMHRFFTQNPPLIGGVDWPFTIEIEKDLDLIGSIDLLLYTDDTKKKLLALKLTTSSYEASKMYGANSLDMVAYKTTLSTLTKDLDIGYFILENINNPLVITHRGDEQKEILFETVKNIAASIKENRYYPDYGYKCHGCDYKPTCNKGRWNSEKEEK